MRLFFNPSRPTIRQLKRRITESHLFDPVWYRQTYFDVAQSRQPSLDHFVRHGRFEGRNPGPSFDAGLYKSLYGSQLKPFDDAFTHYLFVGLAKGLDAAIKAPTVFANSQVGMLPASHDPEQGDADQALYRDRSKRLRDSGMWDGEWYLKHHPDVAHVGADPLAHFLNYGSLERRSPCAGFDAKWYYSEYLLENTDVEPVFHYLDAGKALGHEPNPGDAYQHWLRCYNEMRPADQQTLEASLATAVTIDLFYLFESADAFHTFLASLRAQIGVRWRLTVFDGTGCFETLDAPDHAEINISCGGGTLASIADTVAKSAGRHIVFAEADVVLRPHCLAFFSLAHRHERHALVYANEDRRSPGGPVDPFLKPDYSPRLFRQLSGAFGCFSLYSQDAAAYAAEVQHDEQSEAWTTRLFSALARSSDPFKVESIVYSRQKRWHGGRKSQTVVAPPTPSVCIIIPIKDKIELLVDCLRSIKDLTRYAGRLGILVVDNGSIEPATISYLQAGQDSQAFRVITHRGAFNYSRINNIAATRADADVLLFLNNDMVVLDGLWVSRLVAELDDTQVACVGAKLLYPDRTVQHGGIVLGIQGIAGHAFSNLPADEAGVQGLNRLTREVGAVTGACLAIRTTTFFTLGGLDPALEVAFNDVALCVTALKAGYRNIWIDDALLVHYESKSRGYDTTPAQRQKFLTECLMFRRDYWKPGDSDPFYSRNFSLETPYRLALPPRRGRLPAPLAAMRLRKTVLVLSSTYQVGHGVAVVIAQHVEWLKTNGFDVVLAGSRRSGEMTFLGATRLYIDDARSAAEYATRHDVDCVIAHTPPYFSVVRYLGAYPAVVLYDYGEPNPDWFPDHEARRQVNDEKRLCFAMGRFKTAISAAVRDESGFSDVEVLPLANSHLGTSASNNDVVTRAVRDHYGWQGKYVILNVCRFTKGERHYKGIDRYIDLSMSISMQAEHENVVFVLCGKGTKDDIEELSALGLAIIANPTDGEIAKIYAVADLYVSLSQWEGYNLGIAQALARGLPVLASDIPAHRAFPIVRSNTNTRLVEQIAKHKAGSSRKPALVYEWEESLAAMGSYVSNAIAVASAARSWN